MAAAAAAAAAAAKPQAEAPLRPQQLQAGPPLPRLTATLRRRRASRSSRPCDAIHLPRRRRCRCLHRLLPGRPRHSPCAWQARAGARARRFGARRFGALLWGTRRRRRRRRRLRCRSTSMWLRVAAVEAPGGCQWAAAQGSSGSQLQQRLRQRRRRCRRPQQLQLQLPRLHGWRRWPSLPLPLLLLLHRQPRRLLRCLLRRAWPPRPLALRCSPTALQ